MGLARFILVDPHQPAATQEEITELFAKMDGLLSWQIFGYGGMAVEYDENRINDKTIDAALKGLGFRLMHGLKEDQR